MEVKNPYIVVPGQTYYIPTSDTNTSIKII